MSNQPPLFSTPSAQPAVAASVAGALLLLWVLLLPNRIGEITWVAFARLPLELLPAIMLLLLPGALGLTARWFMAATLSAALIGKLLDLGVDQAFGRPFNPVLDSRFPVDGMHLLTGAIGTLGAWVAVAALGLLPMGLFALFNRYLSNAQTLLKSSMSGSCLSLALGVVVWAALQASGSPLAGKPFVDWLINHWQSAQESRADWHDFKQIVEIDGAAHLSDKALFNRLKGKDLLLIFVESYGRTVFDSAEYAAHIRPLLERSGAELADTGFHMRSSFLNSPTYGGISWLAHGTLLSGLWINSQSRYDRLVMSRRSSLNRLFRRAGWRTVAVQPAHTMPWPQGEYFGYDRVYAAQDLLYRGQPFNWITMPDQYTLSALQKFERTSGPRQPVMAELALISSHAPWTPLPRLLDWEKIGDGQVFNQAREGDVPEVVWQSSERIRVQYRKSIEYVLSTLFSYVKTYGDDNLVILVLGDHQPVPFVSGDSPSREVPIHLISRDPKVIDAIASWQWTPGLIPSAQAPGWGMDVMRDKLVEAFSEISH